MHTARILVDMALLALAVAIAWNVVTQYRKATGSTWDRLLQAAKESATVLWGKFCMLVACFVSQLDNIVDLLGQPEWKDAINAWVGDPKIIAAVMLAISIITITARKRTL